MAIIYETPNFVVETHEKPFVSREEGGHLRISIKDHSITDRTKLSPKVAIEFMRISMIVGEALEAAMKNLGVPVKKINYQDMGNWSYKEGKAPFLHYHIMGRVLNALKQPFPESVYLPDRNTGFYNGFIPLSEGDIQEIVKQIKIIESKPKYKLFEWHLNL